MELHYWFVVSWMQFAFSSLFVLFMTSVAIRWISQPVEKARLIQGVIVSLFALPLLSVFPVFPSSSLSLSSWIAPASQTETTRTRQEQPTPTIIANRIQVKVSKDLASSVVPEPAVHRNPLPSDVVPEKEVRTSFSTGPIESSVQNHEPSLQLTGSELDVWYVACVALILVQALATLTFAVQHWLGTTRLRKILCSAIPATELAKSRWAEITNGLRPKVQLYQSSEIKTPLTFGWRKPIIILPVELVVKAGSDLDACLAHEWSHIERSDALVWIWMNLAQYAFWYQPFYWMLRNELRLCQEFLADHRTVNSVTEPIVYSELLLRLSKIQSGSLPQSALAMFRPSSQLSRRIKVLLDSESMLQTRCRGRFTVCMLVGLVLLAMSISSIRIETAHASEPIEQRATDEPKATVTDAGSAKSARSIRYTMTVLNTKSNTEAVFLETVMEDGRYRSESKSKDAENSIESISDKTGSSITILTSSKTVYSPAHRVGGPNPTWQNLQGLKLGRKPSQQNLETKDLDGKKVSGFVVKQFERTYIVWTDVSTDELVQVEYDAPWNQHVTMNQFQIDELVADALFDCRIPDGHRVNPQGGHPRIAKFFIDAIGNLLTRKTADVGPVHMSLEWTRRTYARRIEASSDGTRLWILGFKQIDLIDSANHRWFAYQVDADNVVNADLDGDGSAEVVTLKRDYTPHSKERIKVSAFSNEGKPLWTHMVDNNLIKRSLASKIVAADLNGDGRDEVLLSFSSGFLVLNADGKAMPNPPKVKIAGLDTGDLCPTKPWIAVSNSIGSVQVINVQTGKSIASIDGQIGSHRMAWMTTAAGHPLLIISKSKSIDAYRIESD